jgi:hypothetical protein
MNYQRETCDLCGDDFPLPDLADYLIGKPVIYTGVQFLCKKCIDFNPKTTYNLKNESNEKRHPKNP